MPFLPPNQQRQSTEGKDDVHYSKSLIIQISTVTIYASEIINWNILHSSELTLIQLEDYKKTSHRVCKSAYLVPVPSLVKLGGHLA